MNAKNVGSRKSGLEAKVQLNTPKCETQKTFKKVGGKKLKRGATMAGETRERKWLKPSRRAKGYAEERKKGIHLRGDKKDQPLDDYNKGLRSGYMLAQSDNAGMHKYKQAMNAGATKEEATAYSKIIGKGGEEMLDKIDKRNKKK